MKSYIAALATLAAVVLASNLSVPTLSIRFLIR
jgi:hypothetical protein